MLATKIAIPLSAGAGLLWACMPAAARSFVCDPPSLSGCPGSAAACIHDEGPAVAVNLLPIGLVPGDVIDAISLGNDQVAPWSGALDIYFSVTRASAGMVGTAVRAALPEHAGDLFVWQRTVGNNSLASPGHGWAGLDGDEGNAGMLIAPPPGDNVSGVELDDMAWAPGPGNTHPSFEIYFSLAPGSPSLATYSAGPADILVVGGAYGPTPAVWRTAQDLGLPMGSGADIDAMALIRSDTFNFVRYSLTTASVITLLGTGHTVSSGAELLASPTTGLGYLTWLPNILGLLSTDDIDALEFRDAENPQQAEIFGNSHEAVGVASLDAGGPHLVVSNIGSSGEDGVVITPPEPDQIWRMDTEILALQGVMNGAVLGAFVVLNDGIMRTTVRDDGSELVVSLVDLGLFAAGVTVQSYLNGELQSEAMPNMAGDLAMIMDDTAWPTMMSADATEPDKLIYTWSGFAPTSVIVYEEPAMVADEIRLILIPGLAADVAPISSMVLTGRNLGELTITNETVSRSPTKPCSSRTAPATSTATAAWASRTSWRSWRRGAHALTRVRALARPISTATAK
jgi:hypothetical protein